MNILHLLSNRKWTERSEPVADLVLAQQALGHNALLACGKWTLDTNHESSAEVQAKKKGLEPIVLHLDKHFNWANMKQDVPAISHLIAKHNIDVLHAHMENGHLLAALARRSSPQKPIIVSSCYTVDGPKRGLRNRALYRRHTDGCTVINDVSKEVIVSRYKMDPNSIAVIEPGIDLERFHPNRHISETFAVDIPQNTIVMGMVTRIRADRRVDLAVSALDQLKGTLPQLRLLIIGHGEAEPEIREQVKRAGLENRVIWGGYCRGDQLTLAYRTMDLLIYPIPGTDQSCRTVREALAAGVPVIASRTGFLNSLIEENITGIFTALDPHDLSAKLLQLCKDPLTLPQLKKSALSRAAERFSLKRQAESNLVHYQHLLDTSS